jgi:hypothetical protein
MNLERRIERLEAAESIRNLKARYCTLCDDGYVASELAELFTEDATWDGGTSLGVHHGRAAIQRFFESMPATLSFAIHHVTNGSIEVAPDAKSATGQWLLLQMGTAANNGRALWIAGTYDDTYVRVEERWRFQRVVLSARFVAPYDRGWSTDAATHGSEGPTA